MKFLVTVAAICVGACGAYLAYRTGVEIGAAQMRGLLYQAHICIWEDL